MFNKNIIHIPEPMEPEPTHPLELSRIVYVMLNKQIDDISCMHISNGDCLEFKAITVR